MDDQTPRHDEHSWHGHIAAMTWRVHSNTRDGLWHLVIWRADGEWACSCEWAQMGGLRLKPCKHIAIAQTQDAPRPRAEWTEDPDAPTAAEWAAALRQGKAPR